MVQSLIAFWFSVRFDADPAFIGGLLAAANVLAGFSALVAVPLAARIGLVRTMVYTHLPSNVLLILVPFMPTVQLAAVVLLVRFSISQMDVPTRQSYTLAVVDPDERSAAAGVTGIARSVGAAAAPVVSAPLMGVPGLAALPFVIGGSLKIAYDLLLYRGIQVRPASGGGVACGHPGEGEHPRDARPTHRPQPSHRGGHDDLPGPARPRDHRSLSSARPAGRTTRRASRSRST